jgi:hypothetical protein
LKAEPAQTRNGRLSCGKQITQKILIRPNAYSSEIGNGRRRDGENYCCYSGGDAVEQ